MDTYRHPLRWLGMGLAALVSLSACLSAPIPATQVPTQTAGLPTATAPLEGQALRIGLTGAAIRDLVDTEWRLADLPGAELPAPNPTTLEIQSDRIGGYAGCNWYGSAYLPTTAGLTWAQPAITTRACAPAWMALEATFFERLSRVTHWRREGNRLEWRDLTGAVVVAFDQRIPADVSADDLIGRWVWVDAGLGPSPAWIAFDGARFTGNTGCRNFEGDYRVAGDHLFLGAWGMSSAACTVPEADLGVEAPIIAALDSVTYFARDGDHLVLETTTLTRSVWVSAEATEGAPSTAVPATMSATMSATVTATPTPPPAAPTAAVVAPGPTSTPVEVITPTITSFTVSPVAAQRGEALTLAWASTGGLTATLQHRDPNSWWGVEIPGSFPLSGTVVISDTTRDEGVTAFILTVYGPGGGWAQQEVSVRFPCLNAYFFTNQELGSCPLGAARSSTIVMQRFERGWMVWFPHESGGTVTVLYDGGRIATYADVWTEGQPATDPTLTPPPDLYQPVRGFGLVWRTQPGVRDGLGWAVVPEGPYATQIQSRSTGGDWKAIDYYFRIWDGRIVRVTGRTMPGQWQFVTP
ncbi:MAG: META domain-containing protein [Anaerolineales bacterium]|nr:META domain-containing protein [Anaerolineales bacterium]